MIWPVEVGLLLFVLSSENNCFIRSQKTCNKCNDICFDMKLGYVLVSDIKCVELYYCIDDVHVVWLCVSQHYMCAVWHNSTRMRLWAFRMWCCCVKFFVGLCISMCVLRRSCWMCRRNTLMMDVARGAWPWSSACVTCLHTFPHPRVLPFVPQHLLTVAA